MKLRIVLFVAFAAVVWAANATLERYGLVQLVGPGDFTVPAGVYWAGIAFGIRDALHEAGGHRWVLSAVATGAVLSWWLSDAASIPGGVTSIAVASGLAFAVSEVADWAIYSPLRERSWPGAVVASNVVGSVVDSLLFLWLAFGSVEFWQGQVIGKWLMVAVSLPLVWGVRRVVSRDR